MAEMTVRVVTPDKLIFDGTAQKVLARGVDGDFAILSRHAPMMTPLGIGELKIVDSTGKDLYLAIDSGILEVSQNHVNILSSDAVLAEEIDVASINMELERQNRAKQNAKTREEQIRQDLEIHKLLNQLKVGSRKS